MSPPYKERGALRRPLDQEATAPKPHPRRSEYSGRTTEVDELLEIVRTFERAARQIADGELPLRGKCIALMELRRQARLQTHLPEFAELSIWRGSSHLFEDDGVVPRDTIEANRRLLRRGLSSCPTCLRDIPSHTELDRWRELAIESFRRSA